MKQICVKHYLTHQINITFNKKTHLQYFHLQHLFSSTFNNNSVQLYFIPVGEHDNVKKFTTKLNIVHDIAVQK